MIDWLVQTTDAHPDLARGVAPEGLLCPAEQRRLDALAVAKRRRDWLLGRWTAKRLLQRCLARRSVPPRPDALCLLSAPDGAPLLELHGAPAGLALSVSHSRGRAFCALCEAPGVALGADIEYIEPRAPAFALDYFTAPELDLLDHAPGALRDTLVTAIWSAKEAALKALRLGLTVDTRLVTCLPCPPDVGWEEPRASLRGWMPATVTCDPALTGGAPARFQGWWRVEDGFTLTIVTRSHRSPH